MKRQTIGVCAGLAMAAALVTAQVAAQSAQNPQTKPAEITLTGCLIQGSTPTLFVFDNAKKDPASKTEPGVSYLVINQIEDVDLTQYVNHQVRLTGRAEMKVVPERPPTEKDLPTFTATEIVDVSSTCAATGQ